METVLMMMFQVINNTLVTCVLVKMSTPYERSLIDDAGREVIVFFTGQSMYSNFFNSPIRVGNLTYPTAEHYYQCYKALYFGDLERYDAIFVAPNPRKAKQLAREIKNFNVNI